LRPAACLGGWPPKRLKEGDVHARYFVGGVMLGLALCATEVSAQSASRQSPVDGWQVQFVPYLWGAGLDGQVGIGNRTADVDASFSNILSHLHFAAMGMADARRNKLVVLTDALYTDVRGQDATPGPLFSSVSPQQKLFILTPEAGYRVVDGQDTFVDVVGGIRLWHTNSELQFQAGLLPSVNLQSSRDWVDAIGGLRVRRALAHRWWASAYGDAGGGGSSFTYQIVGNAGLDLEEHYALVFGYRYLKVDYEKNSFLLDTAMKGPLFGFTFKF
jgi:hypothetical protein